mmetsp:Transcript_33255/g.105150  ORF Transcript_33255/g.105150 Transcript_33255/m.105150 type:complete len:236 (-) Transcript_33255:104-811(-)
MVHIALVAEDHASLEKRGDEDGSRDVADPDREPEAHAAQAVLEEHVLLVAGDALLVAEPEKVHGDRDGDVHLGEQRGARRHDNEETKGKADAEHEVLRPIGLNALGEENAQRGAEADERASKYGEDKLDAPPLAQHLARVVAHADQDLHRRPADVRLVVLGSRKPIVRSQAPLLLVLVARLVHLVHLVLLGLQVALSELHGLGDEEGPPAAALQVLLTRAPGYHQPQQSPGGAHP